MCSLEAPGWLDLRSVQGGEAICLRLEKNRQAKTQWAHLVICGIYLGPQVVPMSLLWGFCTVSMYYIGTWTHWESLCGHCGGPVATVGKLEF